MKIDGISGQYSFEVHVFSLRSFIGKVKVFLYISGMTDIDKFYSDADKLVARASVPGSLAAGKLASELNRMFLIWTRDFATIGPALADYWSSRYQGTLDTETGRTAAIEWLASAVSLLAGCFTPEMDFPDEDWNEIRDIISAEADTLDMELVMSLMSIIVERGKA